MRVALTSALLVAFASPAYAGDVEECADAAEKGQELARARKHLEAKQAFLRCVQSACPQEIRDVCAPLLEDTQKRVGQITIRVRDADGKDIVAAKVWSNGSPFQDKVDGAPRELDPGVYRLYAESGKLRSKELEVVIADGERRSIDLVLPSPEKRPPPPPPGGGPGPAPWIVGGIGLAALTTFGILQGVGHLEQDELEETCGVTGTCDPDEVASLDAQYTASVVVLSIGGAALVTSAILFFTLDDTVVSVQAGPGTAGVTLTQRF